MKYCSHCGNELLDEAVICPKCGCQVDIIKKDKTSTPSDKEILKTVAKVFMIIGCVAGAAAFLIPLAWCIPMTVVYWRKVDNNEPVSVGFKVCTLLFVNLVAGILMLCTDD